MKKTTKQKQKTGIGTWYWQVPKMKVSDSFWGKKGIGASLTKLFVKNICIT